MSKCCTHIYCTLQNVFEKAMPWGSQHKAWWASCPRDTWTECTAWLIAHQKEFAPEEINRLANSPGFETSTLPYLTASATGMIKISWAKKWNSEIASIFASNPFGHGAKRKPLGTAVFGLLWFFDPWPFRPGFGLSLSLYTFRRRSLAVDQSSKFQASGEMKSLWWGRGIGYCLVQTTYAANVAETKVIPGLKHAGATRNSSAIAANYFMAVMYSLLGIQYTHVYVHQYNLCKKLCKYIYIHMYHLAVSSEKPS